MKNFGAFVFTVVGVGFFLYAFPQTRAYLPDIFKNRTTAGRVAFDDGVKYLSLGAAGISWLVATILKVQDIKLKNYEIAEKRHARQERERQAKHKKK